MSDWTPEFVAAYKRLEAELAAEREKVQTLQDALDNVVNEGHPEQCEPDNNLPTLRA